MNRNSILAPFMLRIKYSGDDALHTCAFARVSGTNSEGLLTLTDDTGALTFNCDAYATLTTLIDAINAYTAGRGWAATPCYGLPEALITEATGLTQRVISAMSATTVPKTGLATMIFTNDYEVVGTGAVSLLTARALPTFDNDNTSIQMVVDGTDAGYSSNVTYDVFSNPLGKKDNVAPNWDISGFTTSWDTVTLSASLVIAVNGLTEARKTIQLDCNGVPQIKFSSVTNANAGNVNVGGTFNVP